ANEIRAQIFLLIGRCYSCGRIPSVLILSEVCAGATKSFVEYSLRMHRTYNRTIPRDRKRIANEIRAQIFLLVGSCYSCGRIPPVLILSEVCAGATKSFVENSLRMHRTYNRTIPRD